MARPSETALRDRERARGLTWARLGSLWRQIRDDKVVDWHEGKALEYLVVRGFELSKLPVEYPYDVPPAGNPIEQIDGLVFLGDTPFLIECKDRHSVDVEAIAKLRNQLLRRPPTTMGCVFVTGTFTRSALILADFAVPQQMTLWSGEDIDRAVSGRDFKSILIEKYRNLCMYGLSDYSPNYRPLEVEP